MSRSGLPIAVTDVDTEAKMPLGYVYVEPESGVGARADQGAREWVYVHNAEASTAWALGNVIVRDSGAKTFDGVLSAGTVAAHRVLGAAQHAIPAGSYGFILKRGPGKVLADGNVTKDSPIVSDSAGDATDMSAGEEHCVFGLALEDDAGATLVDAWINCPGS